MRGLGPFTQLDVPVVGTAADVTWSRQDRAQVEALIGPTVLNTDPP